MTQRACLLQVYKLFLRYEQLLVQQERFDNMDLVSHILRELDRQDNRAMVIHDLYRDEVQDFTQAELLMDMRYGLCTSTLYPVLPNGNWLLSTLWL